MTTYNWYCPECGAEDYGIPPEGVDPPRCKQCDAEMCKLEPDDDDMEAMEEGMDDDEE